jgi:hypothetical protein
MDFFFAGILDACQPYKTPVGFYDNLRSCSEPVRRIESNRTSMLMFGTNLEREQNALLLDR